MNEYLEREEIGRFQAKSDRGVVHTVVERQTIIVKQRGNGQVARVRGTKDFMLSDGRAVNEVDSTTFQIVETDEIIRKL